MLFNLVDTQPAMIFEIFLFDSPTLDYTTLLYLNIFAFNTSFKYLVYVILLFSTKKKINPGMLERTNGNDIRIFL